MSEPVSEDGYPLEAQTLLLDIARQTLQTSTAGSDFTVDLAALPQALQENRACFVTLWTRPDGELRGCTGSLIATQPLAHEVIRCTRQTAFTDPRFYPVTADEVPNLRIEISVLTPPQPLDCADAGELVKRLRRGVDGVVLQCRGRRATFLPQVWQHFDSCEAFLGALCRKMGLPENAWQETPIQVETYTSIEMYE